MRAGPQRVTSAATGQRRMTIAQRCFLDDVFYGAMSPDGHEHAGGLAREAHSLARSRCLVLGAFVPCVSLLGHFCFHTLARLVLFFLRLSDGAAMHGFNYRLFFLAE